VRSFCIRIAGHKLILGRACLDAVGFAARLLATDHDQRGPCGTYERSPAVSAKACPTRGLEFRSRPLPLTGSQSVADGACCSAELAERIAVRSRLVGARRGRRA
jgi:hypothetical protein